MARTFASIPPLAAASAIALALVAAGCKRTAPAPTPTAALGTERGPCRSDRTCDVGLLCLSDLCVRPPPADCAKVAETLGGIFLDNYAPREVRAQFASDVSRECSAAGLTKDDGECLARAKSRSDLAACPRPLGLGDCKKIAAHAEKLRATNAVDAYLVTPSDRLVERCKSEVPSRAFETCVLAATSMEALERCPW